MTAENNAGAGTQTGRPLWSDEMSKRILIADDEPNIRNLVHIALEDEGFELFEAKDGPEAIEKARAIKPDLMILDVMMPGMIGYEVCEVIKKDPEVSHTIVFFLSSRVNPNAERAGKLTGGDYFMTKPFKPKELRTKVTELLKII